MGHEPKQWQPNTRYELGDEVVPRKGHKYERSGIGYSMSSYEEACLHLLGPVRTIITTDEMLPKNEADRPSEYIRWYPDSRPALYRIKVTCEYEPLSHEESERVWEEYAATVRTEK